MEEKLIDNKQYGRVGDALKKFDNPTKENQSNIIHRSQDKLN